MGLPQAVSDWVAPERLRTGEDDLSTIGLRFQLAHGRTLVRPCRGSFTSASVCVHCAEHALRWISLILCAVLIGSLPACGRDPTPLPETVTTPTATRVPRPRVLLLSLGGAGDALVDQYLDEGVMPNLAAMAERGSQAEHVVPVDPASTLTAHVSMAYGAYPDRTNQVGERLHLPENPIDTVVQGLDAMQLSAEPLWRMAMRHGLTTATLFWPGARIDDAAPRADLTVTQGAAEMGPALHVLTTTVATEWSGAPLSYSPLLESTLPIMASDGPQVLQLCVLMVDSTDDQEENYDSVYLSESRAIAADATVLHLGRWAEFEVRPRLYGRGRVKLVAASAERIEIYRTALWYNRMEPAELLRDINERFGFCPPPPDEEAYQQGWITADDLWEMSANKTRWMGAVIGHVFGQYQPDLALAWLGVTEEMGRQFLTAPEAVTQLALEVAEQNSQLLAQSYALADATLGELLSQVVLGRDTVLVVSDHGLAPAHSALNVNSLLKDAGLLSVKDGAVQVAETRAFAVASGGSAHIYANLEGREVGGIVSWEGYDALSAEIVDLLLATVDGDGRAVFERVLSRKQQDLLRMDSFASGDAFAQARPGIVLSDELGAVEAYGQPTAMGAAGYSADDRSMHAILVAAGFGIRRSVRLPVIHAVDIAPTVAHLLRLRPAEQADGRVVTEMLQSSP